MCATFELNLCLHRNPYSDSIKEMLTTFGTATYKVGLKVHPNEEDPRVPIMCWGSCAYTIQSIGETLHSVLQVTELWLRNVIRS